MFFLTRFKLGMADVTAAIGSGKCGEVLRKLNEKKAVREREENIDYRRALCFLANSQDVFHARQALLEELRHFPNNTAARTLLLEVNETVRPLLMPPKELLKSEPLFGLLCDALLDHTMLTWTRLYSLYRLSKEVCSKEGEGGALMECGVSGGGSVVLLAVVAAHYSKKPRKIYALDTFSGMPEPTTHDNLEEDGNLKPAESTSWGSGTCSATVENVRQLAKNFDVEEGLVVIPGLFHETMPKTLREISDEGISMLHVDADWYESTRCALELAWPMVKQGGVVQVDDYHYWLGCRKAVDEFAQREESEHRPLPILQNVDGNAVYFTKP
ncbi:hypothetical protein, conserved [Trypanosoma brucei gambiense DAL972]|uniref:Macrocin-O-methyltransferase domain-containing protein n=2 Tax=Trypanosoma brucei TaxID=5691 RepID=D0A459_TRYB9|nr:hypothetical protein, conserved [Trypanosoma brucei gambiense DAL972]RHW68755.1 Macrocin-O-methyltransferase (TylF) [Trypanosoma brucei equiperdum]CBH16053.1 hypothetical protein, conserved [Trypanosoma brucei gambiense DAL972]|eukprot:XP_011778317.1 hypothetical protein, conserved [Trypanosoma brucei gambiense DAL972]